MEQRYCPYCGRERSPDARFCAFCGQRLEAAALRRSLRIPPRWAPVVVAGVVLAAGAGGVVHGLLFPAPKGGVPRAEAQREPNLPADHPPIEIPQQVKEAIREVVQRAQAEPENLELWRQAAQVQYRAGLVDPTYFSGAAAAYRHVLERAPEDLESLRALGNIAYEQRQPDIAIAYYQQYLAKKPEDLEVRTDLGTMLLAAGQTQQALDTYRAVLRDDPKFFQAHFNLGVAYHGLGQMDEAVAAFTRARDFAPNEQTRAHVERVLAQSRGEPPPSPAAEQQPASFREAAEGIFRQNPVMGPKVERVEWPRDDHAKVYVRDFPMDEMGPEMKAIFRERMAARIREQKSRFQVTASVRFEVVDTATGKAMETLVE